MLGTAGCDSKSCGWEMAIFHNEKVYGAASFAAAVGKKYDLHDVFVCPHAGREWHERALRLVLAIEETPSKRVAELMRLDLADLLAENGL